MLASKRDAMDEAALRGRSCEVKVRVNSERVWWVYACTRAYPCHALDDHRFTCDK